MTGSPHSASRTAVSVRRRTSAAAVGAVAPNRSATAWPVRGAHGDVPAGLRTGPAAFGAHPGRRPVGGPVGGRSRAEVRSGVADDVRDGHLDGVEGDERGRDSGPRGFRQGPAVGEWRPCGGGCRVTRAHGPTGPPAPSVRSRALASRGRTGPRRPRPRGLRPRVRCPRTRCLRVRVREFGAPCSVPTRSAPAHSARMTSAPARSKRPGRRRSPEGGVRLRAGAPARSSPPTGPGPGGSAGGGGGPRWRATPRWRSPRRPLRCRPHRRP